MALPSIAALAVSAAASHETYVPVIKPMAEDVSAAFSLISYGVIAAALGFGVNFIYREWVRDPLIIDPLDIPPDLASTGLSGSVLSQQLYDELVVLQRSVRPDDGQSDTSFVELPRLQLDLQLPGTSWSVRSAIRYFKYLIGRPERRLMGEVCRIGKSYLIRVRNGSGGALEAPVRFHGPSDVLLALRSAAEQALVLINPLDAASVFMSMENPGSGYERTVASLRAHLATTLTGTHQGAYVMWASVLRSMGDESGMRAKLDLARATPAAKGVDRPEGRLGARYLNFMGSLHRERREFSQAEKCFTLALVAEPDNLAAISNLGVLHLDAGNFANARHWFERTVRMDDRSSRGHRGLGLVANHEGDRRSALTHLTRAIDVAPRARWAMLNLSEVLRNIGRLDDADRQLDKLQDIDPAFPPQYRARSDICRERGQPSRALKWAQRAVDLDPRDPWARSKQAQAALELGDSALALAFSQDLIRLAPHLAEGYRWAASALQQAGEFDAALAMFRRCSSLNADIWAWLDEASHLHRRGDMVACLNVLEAASVRWPERVDIWRRLAKWYHVQGNWKKAEACLWTAVKISPRDVWSRCELAEVQLRLGQRDNALQSLEQARETWSQPARVLRLQSRLHRDALEHAEAEASLREALAIQPSDVQAWVDLADLLARQERFKEARGLCIPKNNEGRQAAALLRRDAWLLHEMGAPLKARSRMLEAVAAAPHVLECWLELSKLNRRLSDWAEAQRAAAYAVQYWPGEPEAWVVLGEACAGRNDLSGAHRAFGRALNLVPDVEWVGFRYVEALSPHDREALHTAESLVSRCPASIDVRLRAANLLADLGRGEEAINLLKDAAAAAPAEDERPLLQQAEILIDLKRTEAGMKTAAGVLARRLQSTRAMRALARGHKALGQLPQAEAQLRAALVRDPLDVNNWIELAWLAVDKNNPRTTPSQAVLEEALEQNPHSLRLRRDLLGLCVDVGDTARARALLDELLSLNPLDPQDLVRWSYSVFRLGLSEPDREAAHAVAAALDRQPESWAAWLRQSELLERTSDSKAALEAAMRALDSARAVPKPLTMLKVARQLMWTGDTKLASEVADQVLRDQPVRDPWMLSIAALIYQKAELWPQCIECLRSAVKLQPDDNDLQTRLQAALHASANPP